MRRLGARKRIDFNTQVRWQPGHGARGIDARWKQRQIERIDGQLHFREHRRPRQPDEHNFARVRVQRLYV
jgi:hypothetical protein